MLSYARRKKAGQVGFEPTTSGFGDRRSNHWSYWPVRKLLYLGFFMEGMLAVKLTVFAQLHLSLDILPVLFGRIIFPLALCALKRYFLYRTLFFTCHDY